MQEQVLPAELNEYQRKAVFNDSRACLVNANVGSGKTIIAILALLEAAITME